MMHQPTCTSSGRMSGTQHRAQAAAQHGLGLSRRRGHRLEGGRRRGGSSAARVGASDSDSPPLKEGMTVEQACSLLGVDADYSSFDRVVAAKNRSLRVVKTLEEKTQIEAAYDTLLMRGLNRRLTGQAVDKRARFADVPPPGPPRQVRKVLQALPFQVGPANGQASIGAVYAVLASWALAQGLLEPPVLAVRDVPGTQLALGLLASLWLFKDRKNQSLPRSGLLAGGGLIAGAAVGALLQGLLHVEVHPLLGLQSPGIFVSEFGLLGLWAATAYVF